MRKQKQKLRPAFKLILVLLVIAIGLTIYDQQDNQKADGEVNVLDGDAKVLKAPDSLQEAIDILSKRAKQDHDYQIILEQVSAYDEDLLLGLAINPELKDFILHYFEAPKHDVINTKKDVENTSIPLFIQWDERWAYESYGDGIIGTTGCGPSALAMVVAGLTKRTDINPKSIAIESEQAGYYVYGSGSSWDLMTLGSEKYGVKVSEIAMNEDIVIAELTANHPIICSVNAGDFTTAGHFIVLTGVDEYGAITIHDSNSKKRSKQHYSFQRLQQQVRAAWVYSL